VNALQLLLREVGVVLAALLQLSEVLLETGTLLQIGPDLGDNDLERRLLFLFGSRVLRLCVGCT
jgi:hypothetical protein